MKDNPMEEVWTDRQTDRQTDNQIDRQTDRDRQTEVNRQNRWFSNK